MAIAAGATFEVRTTGDDSNGGFYTSGGTDYSQQDAAQLIVDGATYTATVSGTTITTDAPLTSALIGNGCQVLSGSGVTQGFYQITGINAGLGTITLDRSTSGSGVATTFRIGGALASPGKAASGLNTDSIVYIKSGTYAVTSTTVNISGGRPRPAVHRTYWVGYGSTRNDDGTRPIIQASGSFASVPLWTTNSTAGHSVRNIEFDGASKTGVTGVDLSPGGASGDLYNCVAHHCVDGFKTQTGCTVDNCLSYSNSGNGAVDSTGGVYNNSVFRNNTNDGLQSTNATMTAEFCIFKSNGRYGGNAGSYRHCVAYGNTNVGIRTGTNGARSIQNCISYGNSGTGFESFTYATCYNNAAGNNTGGSGLPTASFNTVTLTADPFVDASTNDFRLNSTAGGGAACKATSSATVAYPATLPSGASNYRDLGAVQTVPASGGVSAGRTFNAV